MQLRQIIRHKALHRGFMNVFSVVRHPHIKISFIIDFRHVLLIYYLACSSKLKIFPRKFHGWYVIYWFYVNFIVFLWLWVFTIVLFIVYIQLKKKNPMTSVICNVLLLAFVITFSRFLVLKIYHFYAPCARVRLRLQVFPYCNDTRPIWLGLRWSIAFKEWIINHIAN